MLLFFAAFIIIARDTLKNALDNIHHGEIFDEPFDHRMTLDFSFDEVIPDGSYFVLGDNRTDSLDSRYIGLVNEKDIEGVVSFSIFPPKKIK